MQERSGRTDGLLLTGFFRRGCRGLSSSAIFEWSQFLGEGFGSVISRSCLNLEGELCLFYLRPNKWWRKPLGKKGKDKLLGGEGVSLASALTNAISLISTGNRIPSPSPTS